MITRIETSDEDARFIASQRWERASGFDPNSRRYSVVYLVRSDTKPRGREELLLSTQLPAAGDEFPSDPTVIAGKPVVECIGENLYRVTVTCTARVNS